MKKNYLKKALSVFIASAVAVSLCGCSSGKGSEQTTAAQTEEKTTAAVSQAGTDAQETGQDVVNHAVREGFPITDEEITLVVGVPAVNAAYEAKWEDYTWIKELEQTTGVKLEFRVYNGGEDVSLMFASRDYPDISFKVGSTKQIQDAALGGDIYPLNDLIDEWSPNWKKLFSENDMARRLVTFDDGNIYSLPQIRDEPSNSDLRDQWLINKVWLDELGLDVPTTTEEYYNALKAFKDNAGRGSIPENVIPLYIVRIFQNVGGAMDIFGSFGVRTCANGTVTVSDDGKIEYNYASDDMVEPLLYLRRLFEEGLIPYDCLTASGENYTTMTLSEPAVVGSYFAYHNAHPDVYTAIPPLDSGNGKKPMIRSQTNWIVQNCFTIYSNCKYPEVAMRLADTIADPDWSVQSLYGTFSDGYTVKNDDGTYLIIGAEDEKVGQSAPVVRVPQLLSRETADKLIYDENSNQGVRAAAVKNVYKDYSIPKKNLYLDIQLTTEQTDRVSELLKDLNDCRNTTVDNWMLNGGIEEGWDDYVSQMKNLGLEEYLSILQEAYDDFNSK